MRWFDSMLRPELASLSAYKPHDAPGGAIRLDANESPYALSAPARKALGEALSAVDTHRYPDVRAKRLRELIADANGAHPDQVLIGCGSDEVIALLVTALSSPRAGAAKPVFAFPAPSFVMFRVTSLVQGAEPVAVPLDDTWDLDAEAFEATIATARPNAIFIPSPNNPTGNRFSDAAIARVVNAAEKTQSLVVMDEAYGAFAKHSYAALRAFHPHVAQMQTLSKIGFAAARVGWAILPRELAIEIDKARQPYNLNTFSQRAAELAFTEFRGEIDAAVDRIIAERARVESALASVRGCSFTPSAANFLWLDVGRCTRRAGGWRRVCG